MEKPTPARSLALCAAAFSLAAGGCLMQASYDVNVTTADGVTLEVPLSAKFVIAPSAIDDQVEVRNFRFMPLKVEPVKTMAYEFALQFKKGSKPASIVVEDDTEDRIWSLYEDTAPKLLKGDIWIATTPGFNPNEERMNWLNSLDNGVRVLRFTVTLTDKSVHVLRLPIFVPGQAKAMFRSELGIK
jgi:hypothetical protein